MDFLEREIVRQKKESENWNLTKQDLQYLSRLQSWTWGWKCDLSISVSQFVTAYITKQFGRVNVHVLVMAIKKWLNDKENEPQNETAHVSVKV